MVGSFRPTSWWPGWVGRELAGQLAATQTPTEMLTANIRRVTVALLAKPGARTAEDRARILNALREVVFDAILDGVYAARPPDAAMIRPAERPPEPKPF